MQRAVQKTERAVLTAILMGGLIAAAIDIVAAAIISSRSPSFILQVIAGGLLGRSAFRGGMGTMALGFILQEAMGVFIAAIYVLLSRFVPTMRGHWPWSGLAYGVAIFFVMNYIVLPLSALKATPHFTALKFAENMVAMLLFGCIVAFFGRRIPARAEPRANKAATAAN